MQLRSVLDLDNEIRCIEERIELLTARAEKITSVWDDMPRGGGISDKTGDGAAELADEKNALLELLARREKQRQEVEKAINKSDDWTTREILTLRYCYGYPLQKIADLIGMSPSGVLKRIKRFNREVAEE